MVTERKFARRMQISIKSGMSLKENRRLFGNTSSDVYSATKYGNCYKFYIGKCFTKISFQINSVKKRRKNLIRSLEKSFLNLKYFLLINLFCLNFNFNCATQNNNEIKSLNHHQPSTYRLISSSSSYAQYPPWFPCLNGSLSFEFKTHEPNSLLFYAQSLPYRYIQLSLADGNLRMRMRIGEKDSPRGQFLVYQRVKLNDEKWHRVDINRANERTMLTVNDETIYYIHKDADLEGFDLYFGNQLNENEANNLLIFGGLPNNLQTYDLSLGTALFEHRFNGFIRNVRAQNCSAKYPTRLNVISSNNLRYVSENDLCISNPCLNYGICSVISDSSYSCDCSFTNYEGKNCEKCKLFLILFIKIISIVKLETVYLRGNLQLDMIKKI